MFSAIDIESLVFGKELTLIVLGLCVVFVFCFVMGLVTIGRSRKIVKTKEDYDDLQRNVSALSTLRDELLKEIAALRGLREELESAKKFLEMHPNLVAESEKLEKSIADKELKLERANAELKNIADRKLELEKSEEKLKEVSRDIAELERDKTALAAEKQAMESELAKLKSDKAELVKKQEELRQAIEKQKQDAEAAKHTTQNLVDQLKREADAAKRERDEAQKWLDLNRAKLQNREDLDHQIAQRRDELKQLDDRLQKGEKAVADTLDRIDKGLDRLNKMNLSGVQTLRQNAFASLKDGVFSITGKAASSNEDEQAALKAVADHIEASKFVVPERLLNAFHTSLKTSDMSSLTVMAGVSGTGKSAIPKFYSEAMGIHFQPLAVEPRWDSPKDLLGFFNYVTNRYEPTALARALFQFQGLHGEDFRPNSDLQEYMLMPMLDEMNLARIEYYLVLSQSRPPTRYACGRIDEDNLL